MNSYGPTCDDENHVLAFQLENDLEPSSAERSADQLVAVSILLVSPNLEIREKALHSFLECHAMLGKFISLKIVLKVGGRESLSVHHPSFYCGSSRVARRNDMLLSLGARLPCLVYASVFGRYEGKINSLNFRQSQAGPDNNATVRQSEEREEISLQDAS